MKFSRIWITELLPNNVRKAKIWFHSILYVLINYKYHFNFVKANYIQKATNHIRSHIKWSISYGQYHIDNISSTPNSLPTNRNSNRYEGTLSNENHTLETGFYKLQKTLNISNLKFLIKAFRPF